MDPDTDRGRKLALTEWTLSMQERGQHVPSPPHPGLRVEQSTFPSYELSYALYSAVGVTVCWTDRRSWDCADWKKWVENPRVQLWIGSLGGTPAGFFELIGYDDGSVEIALFGLIPQLRGQGIGGAFLSSCIEAAWKYSFGPSSDEVSRVFLLTSTLDHPNALKNYLARGFTVQSCDKFDKVVPDPRRSYLDLPFDPRDQRG